MSKGRLTNEQIDRFEMIWGHLANLYKDVESLAKKKQDGSMSKIRVSMINQVLEEVRDVLKGEPSLKFLSLLDDAMLPQNADALIFLGQYKSAMNAFMRKNTDDNYGTRKWKGTNREVDEDVR